MIRWILIFLFMASWANAQDVVLNASVRNPIKINTAFELYIPQNQNQYIASQWSKGKLFYSNGTSKTFDSLNFDRFSNKIEVVVNNKALSVLPMGVSGALIYNSNDSGTLLVVGKVEAQFKLLLVQSNGQFILASYLVSSKPIGDINYKLDEFRFVAKQEEAETISNHYVVFENGNWVKFRLSKSSIGKQFGMSKKELQSKTTKGINTNAKEGLVQLFNVLNGN